MVLGDGWGACNRCQGNGMVKRFITVETAEPVPNQQARWLSAKIHVGGRAWPALGMV